MVTATVISPFWDKYDPERTIYYAGMKFMGTEERIAELAEKGFVEAPKVEKQPTEERPAEEDELPQAELEIKPEQKSRRRKTRKAKPKE